MSPLYFVNVGKKSDNEDGCSCHKLTTWTVLSQGTCPRDSEPSTFITQKPPDPLFAFRQTPVRF